MSLPFAEPLVRDEIQVGAVDRSANASRLFGAPPALAFWHLTSLDAPTVAVVWSLAFAWASRIHLGGRVLLVLALTAWCAYVSDRILDARVLDAREGRHFSARPTRSELRERHLFHWRHRRLFVPMAAAAACAAAVLAVAFIPTFVRERGSVLAAAALVYFSGVHATPRPPRPGRGLPLPLSKELLVAVLFTAGCILPAWSRLRTSTTLEFSPLWFWVSAVYFAALAWLNCRCIAGWESGGEASNNCFDHEGPQFMERMGQRTNLFAAFLVAFTGVLLAAVASASHPRSAALLVAGASSALLLALLDRMREQIVPLALRATADLVLLMPILLFL